MFTSRLPPIAALLLLGLSASARAEQDPGAADTGRCSMAERADKGAAAKPQGHTPQAAEPRSSSAPPPAQRLQPLTPTCPTTGERWVPGLV